MEKCEIRKQKKGKGQQGRLKKMRSYEKTRDNYVQVTKINITDRRLRQKGNTVTAQKRKNE